MSEPGNPITPVATPAPVEASVAKNTVKVSFGTDKEAFDFFLQRKQVL